MLNRLHLLGALPALARLERSARGGPERLAALGEARLRETLRAASRIPFYAERLGPRPERRSLADLPILRREEVPALEASVDSLPRAGRGGARIRTSGSTSAPVHFLVDARHQRGRFAARLRYLRAHGWGPLDRMAWLIGLLPGSPDGDLAARTRILGARFFSHVADFDEQLDWLARLDPVHIYTLPSNLDGLLRRMEERGGRLPALRTVFTGGEVLEPWLRERTRSVLGVPVADSYGTTEAFLAWECPAGRYHVNAEHVALEVVDERDRPVAPGETGRVLFTTLENRVMPLVRYEIGDVARLAPGPCPCGRTLPALESVVGRTVNLFRRRGGRLQSPWEALEALRDIPSVRKAQIVQRDTDLFAVRYAADAELEGEALAGVRAKLQATLGAGVSLAFERVDDIPRTARGKFLAAVSELERAERGADARAGRP